MIFKQFALDESLFAKAFPKGPEVDADTGPRYFKGLMDYYKRFQQS
jgi:hypothetical protein